MECEELGSGGFGKVDKVFDPQTGELFARKTLLKADRDSSRSISDAKAMLAEINMHAKLKHVSSLIFDTAVVSILISSANHYLHGSRCTFASRAANVLGSLSVRKRLHTHR